MIRKNPKLCSLEKAQNSERCKFLILCLVIWEEEDNIAIESEINCIACRDIPSTKLAKNNDGDSKDEVNPEPAS